MDGIGCAEHDSPGIPLAHAANVDPGRGGLGSEVKEEEGTRRHVPDGSDRHAAGIDNAHSLSNHYLGHPPTYRASAGIGETAEAPQSGTRTGYRGDPVRPSAISEGLPEQYVTHAP